MHPFPPDIERMLDEAERVKKNWQDRLPYVEGLQWEDRFRDWEKGLHLDEGRAALRDLLESLRAEDC